MCLHRLLHDLFLERGQAFVCARCQIIRRLLRERTIHIIKDEAPSPFALMADDLAVEQPKGLHADQLGNILQFNVVAGFADQACRVQR